MINTLKKCIPQMLHAGNTPIPPPQQRYLLLSPTVGVTSHCRRLGASIPAQTCGQAGPGLRMSDPQLQPSGFSPIYSCPQSSLNHDRDSLLPEAQSNHCSAGPHEKEGRGVGLSVLQRDSLRRSNFNNWKQVSSQTLLTSQCKHN